MKVLIVGVILAVFLVASNASAWPWSHKGKRREKLPTPIDYPIVRPKADDSHKHGNRKSHPARLQRNEWGSEMGRIMKTHDHPKRTPYLYQE